MLRIDHLLRVLAGASAGSSVMTLRKMSSRLIRIERSSSSPQPRATTAAASSRRTSTPFSASTSKLAAGPLTSARVTRVTPLTFCSVPITSSAGPSHCTTTVAAPCIREVRLSGESTATTLPLLMMTTRWQVCATSGRMWVLSTMVCVPASSRISCRVSMICLGSRPAVGSSSTRTSGLWMMACARPTRCL